MFGPLLVNPQRCACAPLAAVQEEYLRKGHGGRGDYENVCVTQRQRKVGTALIVCKLFATWARGVVPRAQVAGAAGA